MARLSKHQISDWAEIASNELIMTTVMNEAFINQTLDGAEAANLWFAQHSLIKNNRNCPKCVNEPPLCYVKSKKYTDGYKWQCKRPCTFSSSIRTDSFFASSHLSLRDIFYVLYKYMLGNSYNDIAFELDRKPSTISSLTDLAREAICCYVAENSQRIGGTDADGNARIVEIDESLFFKRKYHRGRIRNEQWFVGGIERGTRNCFIVPVENRNSETMLRVIQENVLEGTMIYTDQWRAYRSALVQIESMQHATINHSLYFVDPNDRNLHTQNIEGLWSRSKYFLRKKIGCSAEQRSEYLIQFLWEYCIPKRSRINTLITMLTFASFQ